LELGEPGFSTPDLSQEGAIKDEDLRFIDDLLDDQIINKLLYCYLFFSGNTVPVVTSGFQLFSNLSFDSFAMHEKPSLK
jgi:hypothetical protein